MADEQQVEILKRGVRPWNEWRERTREMVPDLIGARLAEADLIDADLANANLTGADLTRAKLTRANLAGANLAGANLADTDLVGADLVGANLTGADLSRAYQPKAELAGADLPDAVLTGAYMVETNLAGADLAGARMAGAVLTNVSLTGANLVRAVLADAHLTGADLTCANLERADLTGANLADAYVARANLTCARLAQAVLTRAHLAHANLTDADLTGANLTGANLSGANLTGARLLWTLMIDANATDTNLRYTTFLGAKLARANFAQATLSETILADVDLSKTGGLESCQHLGPSIVDHRTLLKAGSLPLTFLRGCGLPDTLITYLPSLSAQPIQFYSVFISYSSANQEFATRLYESLQSAGIRCWYAPQDMQAGKKVHDQIDDAIRVYDRLLVILSHESMTSRWVKTEIAKARRKQAALKRHVLFPIRLVPFDDLIAWEQFDVDLGDDAAKEIREFYVPDFSNWKDHDAFQQSFAKLVKSLKSID